MEEIEFCDGFLTADSSSDEENENTATEYSKLDLENALIDISNGSTVYAASKRYNIPNSTLHDRKGGKGSKKRGRKSLFRVEEEEEISQWIIKCAEKGSPRTKQDLLEAVEKIRRQRFGAVKNCFPSKQWLRKFLERNPNLSFRTPQPITRTSACVTEDDIRRWFATIHSYLENEDLMHLLNDSTRWINGDETGYELNPKPGKVLAAKGSKNVNFVETSNPSERLSVMYTFSADGYAFSPQIILKKSVSQQKIIEMTSASVGE